MRHVCALSLGLSVGEFYSYCCRPERLREPSLKNRSREPPGRDAGIARQRRLGHPQCWQGRLSYETCCDFIYEGLVSIRGGVRSLVRFLPMKSAEHFELQLLHLRLRLRQKQLLGWPNLMAGYSGVLWPGSLALAHLLLTVPPVDRCLELAAGLFALPSVALAAAQRCQITVATDLPNVAQEMQLPKLPGLDSKALDLCDLPNFGTFQRIVSSEGALQSPCGARALLELSTRDTERDLTSSLQKSE